MSLVIYETSFWATWDQLEGQTIREMQENIQALEQEKNLLDFKWNNFKIGNSSLWNLIRTDLDTSEQTQLINLVEQYNSEKNIWEQNVKTIIENQWDDTTQRKELVLLKKDFYSNLIPYVSQENLQELMTYIGTDLSLNQKSKDVDIEILKIKNSKNQRVKILQDKIEDNNKVLRESIENKIATQIKPKLDIFTTQWDFSKLPNQNKIEVFERVITKLEYESIRLTNLRNSTSIVEEKIIVFRVVINLLENYKNSWSE